MPTVRKATMMGWLAPSVAATPPGRFCAATNSNGKNTPMLSTPRTKLRSIHTPCGSCREMTRAMSPAGSERIMAANTGCPGGKSFVVTM